MKKETTSWTIETLLANKSTIDFPEYQREPNVWSLNKKQRLIDSILRGFDISSIYFYKRKKGFDCIDGRQRLNAIFSYMGTNNEDQEDNEFHLKVTNEIYSDKGKFKDAQNKRFAHLPPKWQEKIKAFRVTVVELSDLAEPEELNLLFLRLQLGMVLNLGEKLHAMTGDIRDFIFNEFAQDDFFKLMDIPYRRYAKEQVAAQIVLNIFSKEFEGGYKRGRYTDLQEFFQKYNSLNTQQKGILQKLRKNTGFIHSNFKNYHRFITNRAIAVSAFLILYSFAEKKDARAIAEFGEFLKQFVLTLRWQMLKGIRMDHQYEELLTFQVRVTQASVEKSAVEFRDDFLRRYYSHFVRKHSIKGDEEYRKDARKDPNVERKDIEVQEYE